MLSGLKLAHDCTTNQKLHAPPETKTKNKLIKIKYVCKKYI